MTDAALERHFCFRPGLRLRVAGASDALTHYEHEYTAARSHEPEGDHEVDVDFGEVGRWPFDALSIGGHKSVGWRVWMSDPHEHPLAARIHITGWPRSFALSLTQGYFVEPLISIAAARSGRVLLPGAAIATRDGLVIVLGRSGTGKTSLSAGALSLGVPILGDDQVLVDVWGVCSSFPRRLRLYPDVAHTVPTAYARLSRRTRTKLAARRALEIVSGGYIRPSLPVDIRELAAVEGGSAADTRSPDPMEKLIARVVMLEPTAGVGSVRRGRLELSTAVESACELLAAQRLHLRRLEDARWGPALSMVADVEREILKRAFANASLERLIVPRGGDGAHALAAVANRLGLSLSTSGS